MINKVLVAITCYNCEKQIGRVIEGFDLRLLERLEKVIVIDNQSKDGTIESAITAIETSNREKFIVMRNDENYGLGGSHKVAFNYGYDQKMDYVVILHGDDQAKTQEIHNLLDEVEKDSECYAVLGSRFMDGSVLSGYSLFRTYGNRLLNLFFTLVAFKNTKDLGSGLNIFKLTGLSDRRYLKFPNGLTFNINLLLDYYKKGLKIKFIPISWSETDQISNAKAFRVGFVAVETLFFWRFFSERKECEAQNIKYSSTIIFNGNK